MAKILDSIASLSEDARVIQAAEPGAFAIEVNKLVKRYPGVPGPTLDNVSFYVRAGEIFGLLGPNGAGKTTTIRILTAQTHLTSGQVLIAGYDVMRNPAIVKKNIAVVAQRPNLDKDLTPRDNLLFHATYFGVPRAIRQRRADELLEQLGLSDWRNRKIQQFSGGMAQRLMIARALMTSPALLFLDEPTNNLDPQSRLFLWEKIRDANTQGTTIILTTHNLEEADQLCQRVGIIDHGQLIALDTPAALKSKVPGSARLEILVAPCEDTQLLEFTTNLRRIPEIEQVEVIDNQGDPLKEGKCIRLCTTAQDVSEDILHTVIQSGLRLRELRLAQPSLEDLFIHLTGKDLRS